MGETITFTASGVSDSGGIKRVFCTAKEDIPPVEVSYEWRITKPDGSTIPPLNDPPGTGPVATVVTDQPGNYSCTFTAKADRDCPPNSVNLASPPGIAKNPELTAVAILFRNSGELNLYPPGDVLSPPPGGWHYDADAGGAKAPARYPFAGVTGAEPLMDVKFRITDNETCDTVTVRALVQATELGRSVLSIAGEIPFDGTLELLGGSSAHPQGDRVGRRFDSVDFECSPDNGQSWFECGSGEPLSWYIMPSLETFGEIPYGFGYQKVVEYAEDESDLAQITAALNTGIAGDILYDPTEPDPDPNIYHILALYQNGRAQCSGNAALLMYLSRIIGQNAEVEYTWGGASSDRVEYFCYGSWSGPSFRTIAPANGMASENPHFTFHAQTKIGGMNYDPSYGTIGMISFDEVCPAYSIGPNNEIHIPPVVNQPAYTPIQQIGITFPPSVELAVPCVVWRCPHSNP